MADQHSPKSTLQCTSKKINFKEKGLPSLSMSISILASVERVLIAFVSPYRTQTYLFIDSWYKYGEKKNATDRGSQVAGQCLYGEIESPTLSRLNEGDPQYTDPHQDHDEYSVIDKSTNHSTADQQSERKTDRHTEIHVHRETERVLMITFQQ